MFTLWRTDLMSYLSSELVIVPICPLNVGECCEIHYLHFSILIIRFFLFSSATQSFKKHSQLLHNLFEFALLLSISFHILWWQYDFPESLDLSFFLFWLTRDPPPRGHCLGHYNLRKQPLSFVAEIQRVQWWWATVVHQRTWPESHQVLFLDASPPKQGRAQQRADSIWHDVTSKQTKMDTHWLPTQIVSVCLCVCVCGRGGGDQTVNDTHVGRMKTSCTNWMKKCSSAAEVLVPCVFPVSPDSAPPSGPFEHRSGMLKQNTCSE